MQMDVTPPLTKRLSCGVELRRSSSRLAVSRRRAVQASASEGNARLGASVSEREYGVTCPSERFRSVAGWLSWQ